MGSGSDIFRVLFALHPCEAFDDGGVALFFDFVDSCLEAVEHLSVEFALAGVFGIYAREEVGAWFVGLSADPFVAVPAWV